MGLELGGRTAALCTAWRARGTYPLGYISGPNFADKGEIENGHAIDASMARSRRGLSKGTVFRFGVYAARGCRGKNRCGNFVP